MRRIGRWLWLFGTALGVATGCAKAPEGGTVTGTVFLDGKPLADAVIRLWPKDDLNLGVYGGKTDAEGKIVLRLQEGRLVKPGRYVVLIAKLAAARAEKAPPEEGEQINVLSGPEGFRNALPPRYSDKARSPFTVEIRHGRNELPPLELSGRPGR